MKNLLNVNEAARFLNCSRRTLYRIIKEGDIGVQQVRGTKRITSQELSEYVKRNAGIYESKPQHPIRPTSDKYLKCGPQTELAQNKCLNAPGVIRIDIPTITCGVYFLCRGGEVVYVGQSINVGARILSHTDKEFDSYYAVSIPKDRLDDVEGALIRQLRPKLNGVVQGRIVCPKPNDSCDFEQYDKSVLVEFGFLDSNHEGATE